MKNSRDLFYDIVLVMLAAGLGYVLYQNTHAGKTLPAPVMPAPKLPDPEPKQPSPKKPVRP